MHMGCTAVNRQHFVPHFPRGLKLHLFFFPTGLINKKTKKNLPSHRWSCTKLRIHIFSSHDHMRVICRRSRSTAGADAHAYRGRMSRAGLPAAHAVHIQGIGHCSYHRNRRSNLSNGPHGGLSFGTGEQREAWISKSSAIRLMSLFSCFPELPSRRTLLLISTGRLLRTDYIRGDSVEVGEY